MRDVPAGRDDALRGQDCLDLVGVSPPAAPPQQVDDIGGLGSEAERRSVVDVVGSRGSHHAVPKEREDLIRDVPAIDLREGREGLEPERTRAAHALDVPELVGCDASVGDKLSDGQEASAVVVTPVDDEPAVAHGPMPIDALAGTVAALEMTLNPIRFVLNPIRRWEFEHDREVQPGPPRLCQHAKNDVSERSAIEWTDATWNPVRGCTKVSPGCKHCYAETLAERFRGVPGHPFEQGFDLQLVPAALGLPARWRRERLVFVNSMSDLFHERVPLAYIQRVFAAMRESPRHTFQVLTKRAERLEELAPKLELSPNIWMGVSVENDDYLWRIEHLRSVPAAVRFLSLEPLLGPLPNLTLDGIGWVIVGGESGHGARPMGPEWVRAIRETCRRARVPFFFKQWGGVMKSRAGRELDGRTWDQMPGPSAC